MVTAFALRVEAEFVVRAYELAGFGTALDPAALVIAHTLEICVQPGGSASGPLAVHALETAGLDADLLACATAALLAGHGEQVEPEVGLVTEMIGPGAGV